jgi:hypothetical protein
MKFKSIDNFKNLSNIKKSGILVVLITYIGVIPIYLMVII